MTDRAITAIGSENVFAAEIEQAVRDGRADCAVHSCKDLPSALAPGVTLAALTRREDPRDAFVSERFAAFGNLPAGARVGTSSPRRRAQLLQLRADLTYAEVRGNVDTRLAKLREGECDALVVAMAGLNRLGARARYTVAFSPAQLTPCAGQGALAIQMRADDDRVAAIHDLFADVATERAVVAERAFLHAMRAGCGAPIGVYGEAEAEGSLTLMAALAAGSGLERVERTAEVPISSALNCSASRWPMTPSRVARSSSRPAKRRARRARRAVCACSAAGAGVDLDMTADRSESALPRRCREPSARRDRRACTTSP